MKSKRRPARKRLDLFLVERGLADSQKSAQAMILAGEVSLDGAPAQKAGLQVAADARVEFTRRQKFVSRAGLKLEGALEDFTVDPTGLVCLDIGASTGGFTDCLLQRGATKVFAVDVSIAQLDWKLRQDSRVISVECNARHLTPKDFSDAADLVVVDVSFISVTKILGPAADCARPNADFLILIKPQFELPRTDVPHGGVVNNPQLHQKAIESVKQAAEKVGLRCLKVAPSRLKGAEGNQEYFLHARKES
ncbi:MAG TPA: TlyA family RNA methyltransferase [Candidatus Methylomirabilis sp.]|nr:TlyA family RNA methyltransferase [Candidatus Methylomirabilis sp.]